MSKLRRAENDFVTHALQILADADKAMEGRQLLNRFFGQLKPSYVVPSRRQLLTVLRKHESVYARSLNNGIGQNTTFYSLSPILSQKHKNDGSNCSTRRYKKAN
jgi:hypothetical protein